jgi:phenol hydroxylase P1 protein
MFRRIEAALNPHTGNALSLATSFINEWIDDTSRWVDATVKTAADESPDNARQLSQWRQLWRDETMLALEPLARHALGAAAEETLAAVVRDFDARSVRLGLSL